MTQPTSSTHRTDDLPVVYLGNILLNLASYAVGTQKLKLDQIRDTGAYQPFMLVLQDLKFSPCDASEVIWSIMGRTHKEVPAVFLLHGVLHIEGAALAMLWAKSLPAGHEHSDAALSLAQKWGEMVRATEFVQLDDRLYKLGGAKDDQPELARFKDMCLRFEASSKEDRAAALGRLVRVWDTLTENARDRLLNNSPLGWDIQTSAQPLLLQTLESYAGITLLRDCSHVAAYHWDEMMKALNKLRQHGQ